MKKFRPATPAEQRQRTALRSNLSMRRTLDGVTINGLVKAFGVPAAVAEVELAEARKARP